MGRFDNRDSRRRPDKDFRGGFMRSFNSDREMHKAICSECKKECEVPFKPKEDRPVYCKDCFAKRKPRF